MTKGPTPLLLAADADSIATARDHVTGVLEDAGCDSDLIADVVLATSEIVTNAVQASGVDEEIEVAVAVADDAVTLDVANATSRPLPPSSTWRGGDPLRPQGRGLGIVEHLARRLSLDHSDGRVTVTAVFDAD